MSRVIRSEAELSQLLARPGYRIASQIGGVLNNPTPVGPALSEPSTPKYGNEQTDGYASKKEARRAAELRVAQVQGLIRNLREQVPFLLIPAAKDAHGKCIERACNIVVDFTYEEAPTWNLVCEDTKGFRTEAYRIKKKLLYFVHGIRIRET